MGIDSEIETIKKNCSTQINAIKSRANDEINKLLRKKQETVDKMTSAKSLLKEMNDNNLHIIRCSPHSHGSLCDESGNKIRTIWGGEMKEIAQHINPEYERIYY